MRIAIRSLTVFAAGALIAAVSHPAAAQTYPWCALQSASCSNDCSFSTIEQCRAAAAGGGFCRENPAYTAATPVKRDRPRRSSYSIVKQPSHFVAWMKRSAIRG